MSATVQSQESPQDPRRTWLGQRAERTQAIPKHSLQGAGREILSEKELDEVRQIDVKKFQNEVDRERQIRQEKYMHKLPEFLKKRTQIGMWQLNNNDYDVYIYHVEHHL